MTPSPLEYTLYRYTLPLVRPLPLATTTLHHREGLILRLQDPDTGALAYGEAAPLPGFSRETLAQVEAQALALFSQQNQSRPLYPTLKFALESALISAGRASVPASLFDTYHPSARTIVPASVPHLSPPSKGDLGGCVFAPSLHLAPAIEISALHLDTTHPSPSPSPTTIKLKVGRRPLPEDIARVHHLRAQHPRATLRLDANQAWSLEDALTFAHAVAPLDIDYLEEPLQDSTLLPQFAQQSPIAFALDENFAAMLLRDGQLPPSLNSPLTDAADVIVLKPSLTGLYAEIPALEAALRARGKRLVLSAAFESGIGIAALVRLAAALPQPQPAAGLDTYAWLAEDVLPQRLQPVNHGYQVAPTLAAACPQALINVQEIAHGRLA